MYGAALAATHFSMVEALIVAICYASALFALATWVATHFMSRGREW
jgi:hypothetical protein